MGRCGVGVDINQVHPFVTQVWEGCGVDVDMNHVRPGSALRHSGRGRCGVDVDVNHVGTVPFVTQVWEGVGLM